MHRKHYEIDENGFYVRDRNGEFIQEGIRVNKPIESVRFLIKTLLDAGYSYSDINLYFQMQIYLTPVVDDYFKKEFNSSPTP